MRLVIQKLSPKDLRPTPRPPVSYRESGYASITELQHTMFHRNVRPGTKNRLVKFVQKGVIVIEFSRNNSGYRDYDFGDYNIKLAQLITLENWHE